MILAIDPGTTHSGVVVFDGCGAREAYVAPNDQVIQHIQLWAWPDIAIEMIASYGMPVGAEVFETVRWIGRFQQAFHFPERVKLVFRKDVKMHLCGTPRAKDANIRQALIDKLGAPGTKKDPGPTYGVKSHAWAALAVAVTAMEI